MRQSPSGLWVPRGYSFWEHRKTKRTMTSRDGKRALVTVDDSGTAMQIECGDQLHAVVRPRPIQLRLFVRGA